MPETIEELEHKYFMLEMQDTWSSRDYKYADEWCMRTIPEIYI